MRAALAGVLLALAVPGAAGADIPPPPPPVAATGIAPPAEAAAFARQPDIVDRFLDAVLGGPPYYNAMIMPIATDRLARIPDGTPLDYAYWNELGSDEPPILDEIRRLTGLRPQPQLRDPDYDAAAFFAHETVARLKPEPPPNGPALRLPFYTVADPDTLPNAACGAFAASANLFKPRHLANMTIRQLESAPEPVRGRCFALATLRAIGFGGLGEYAGGEPLPEALDPVTHLTAEEKFFLWLLYRLPIGTDREAARDAAKAILAGLQPS
ncbi:hypothetical protein [Zavarzinia compransoris]|uniref:Uncharacterized protein n=1 Tax=Zavarzinia compransoris TaxID=1264899 RepID=A0A317E491_9PROT|nr:hypothetical protein [Zavarzinia compransoris]PWR21030.1 hypothetical protein DKG75_13665 [Zavarzinia compransoris]TDP44062.1 hypothetical protein DES42_108109 [Zavarzinia compransoris]